VGAIVQAVDLVVGDSAPWSFDIATREIVGLLFPLAKPRAPILRVLAGLDAAVAGEVRFPGGGSVVLATSGRPLFEALSGQPDLVLIDTDDVADRNVWALLASERAIGTSFVIATANLDQACRSDRVSMASWSMYELTRAMAGLVAQMTSQTQEFIAMVGEAKDRRSGSLAADLRRLNVGSRALLGEMHRCAHARDEMLALHAVESEVAGVSLNDRLLDAAIAKAQDN
jgi:hypothetical protein